MIYFLTACRPAQNSEKFMFDEIIHKEMLQNSLHHDARAQILFIC